MQEEMLEADLESERQMVADLKLKVGQLEAALARQNSGPASGPASPVSIPAIVVEAPAASPAASPAADMPKVTAEGKFHE
jgi:hypothetical protein